MAPTGVDGAHGAGSAAVAGVDRARGARRERPAAASGAPP